MNPKRMRLALGVLMAALVLVAAAAPAGAGRMIQILHANDEHSHLLGFGPDGEYSPDTTGDDLTIGGIARRAAVIDERAAAEENTVVVSVGDFTMGTLFHVAGPTAAPDLSLMAMAGYQVVTLGNHEFEWGPGALAAMIAAAQTAAGGATIPIVCSNIHFSAEAPEDDLLAALYGDPGEPGKAIYPYYVLTLPNGLRAGFIGLMGIGASAVAPMKAPVSFSGDDAEDFPQLVADAQAAVNSVRAQGVDLVVCLAHLGVNADLASGESLALAANVLGIDVIVSGHMHTPTFVPIIVSQPDGTPTVIAEAGAYGAYLGRLTLEEETGGGFSLAAGSSGLTAIDDTIDAAGSPLTDMIDTQLIPALDAGFLDQFGFSFYQTTATTSFELRMVPNAESNLEDLVCDAIHDFISINFGAISFTPVITVHSNGVVRDPILPGIRGQVSVSDAFRVLPLGIGSDEVPGYSLLRFFLTPAEVRAAVEVGLSQGLVDDDFFLNYAGLKVYFDPNLPAYSVDDPLSGRVVRLLVYDPSLGWTPVFDLAASPATHGWLIDPLGTLWGVETNEYIASFMALYGLAPRDQAGVPGEPADFLLFYTESLQAKEWLALIAYLHQMEAEYGGINPAYDTTTPSRVIPVHYSPPGVWLAMPAHLFHGGDEIWLTATFSSPTPLIDRAHLYVVLDDGTGGFWFWPSWQQALDRLEVNLTQDPQRLTVMEPFACPAVASPILGLGFWGLLLDPTDTQPYGSVSFWGFGLAP